VKSWKKGAIIGFGFGLLGDISYLVADARNFFPTTNVEKVIMGVLFGVPFMLFVYLGFHFYLAFIGPPVIYSLVGALLGYSYEHWRGRN
jgi:hypothetical protein